MKLYNQWINSAFEKNGGINKELWYDYMPKEKSIYENLLVNNRTNISATISQLANEFGVSVLYMCGFLDGINAALDNPLDIKEIEPDTHIDVTLNFENLYKKMVEYKAEHLFTLPQWDNIFDEDKRKSLYKEQKDSRTIRNVEKIGRNDLCPCGSGKKYKKCHGA